MQLYEFIAVIIIIIWCLATFIVSVVKIFNKKTSRFFIFLCFSDVCFLIEELCGTIYWLINPTDIFYAFQTSILGTISVFLFFFTASFGVLDKQIKKEDQTLKTKLISLIAPLVVVATYAITIILCVNNGLTQSIFPLSIMVLPVALCSYFSLKHIQLKSKSNVCKATFNLNLLILLTSFLTMAYSITYLIAPLYVSVLVNFACAIVIGFIPLICIKDNTSWKI